MKNIRANRAIELKKEILSDSRSLVSIRSYILIEGLTDSSKSECLLAIGNVNKAYKSTPKERREKEGKLYNKVIDIVDAEHPKWQFQDFKLVFDEKFHHIYVPLIPWNLVLFAHYQNYLQNFH